MIDVFEQLKEFIKIESNDDFYLLQIIQRKKENLPLGSNSRIIKNYYINDIDYLDEKYPEIKELCVTFNARAMLRLNKRSYRKVAFKAMQNMANTMANGNYSVIQKCYDRACGQSHNDDHKKWIVDVDDVGGCKKTSNDVDIIVKSINDCMPKGHKIFTILKTKNGFHIISTPFNIQEFKKYGYDVDIHKDNPVNLFTP